MIQAKFKADPAQPCTRENERKQKPDSSQMCPETGQEELAQIGIQEMMFKCKKNAFYCKDGQALAQVAQRGCGISVLGDTQNPTGCSAEQPALGDPALAGCWTRQSPEAPSYLNRSVIVPEFLEITDDLIFIIFCMCVITSALLLA